METADDAGVYQLDANTALLQTGDFFTPIGDDPQTSGGLLISGPENQAERLLTALHSAGVSRPAVAARIIRAGNGDIYVT